MIGGKIARRYARALLGLALDEGIEKRAGEDLARVKELFEREPALRQVLENPAIRVSERDALLTAVLEVAGVHATVTRFFRFLLENNRIAHVAGIAAEYRRQADDHMGRISAEVITATPLDGASRDRIAAALKTYTGKDVAIEGRVDPEILAGVVTRIGHVVIDGSLRAQLERLRKELVADGS